MTRIGTAGIIGFLLAAAVPLGCGKEAADAPTADEMPAADASASIIEKELEKLSPEDRELVVLMKDCPVSGEPLGSMGEPIKVTKGDRHLFICCEHCRDAALENFDEYIAAIDAKKSGAEAATTN